MEATAERLPLRSGRVRGGGGRARGGSGGTGRSRRGGRGGRGGRGRTTAHGGAGAGTETPTVGDADADADAFADAESPSLAGAPALPARSVGLLPDPSAPPASDERRLRLLSAQNRQLERQVELLAGHVARRQTALSELLGHADALCSAGGGEAAGGDSSTAATAAVAVKWARAARPRLAALEEEGSGWGDWGGERAALGVPLVLDGGDDDGDDNDDNDGARGAEAEPDDDNEGGGALGCGGSRFGMPPARRRVPVRAGRRRGTARAAGGRMLASCRAGTATLLDVCGGQVPLVNASAVHALEESLGAAYAALAAFLPRLAYACPVTLPRRLDARLHAEAVAALAALEHASVDLTRLSLLVPHDHRGGGCAVAASSVPWPPWDDARGGGEDDDDDEEEEEEKGARTGASRTERRAKALELALHEVSETHAEQACAVEALQDRLEAVRLQFEEDVDANLYAPLQRLLEAYDDFVQDRLRGGSRLVQMGPEDVRLLRDFVRLHGRPVPGGGGARTHEGGVKPARRPLRKLECRRPGAAIAGTSLSDPVTSLLARVDDALDEYQQRLPP